MNKTIVKVMLIIMLLTFNTVNIYAESSHVSQLEELEANEIYTGYTDYEKEIMYRIVYAEAGSSPDLLQQMVTQVILNRWMSSYFPNTIEEVIFQPNQFSPAPWIWSYPIDARVVENVDKVLYEITPCPYNVLFFKTTWCEVYFPWDYYTTESGVDFYSVD